MCPLRGVHTPVPPKGPWGSLIALVGEGPGKTEVSKGSPFVGVSGRILVDIIAEAHRMLPAGVPRFRYDDLWITNVMLCKPKIDLATYLKQLAQKNRANAKAHHGEVNKRLRAGAKPLIEITRVTSIMSPIEACRPRLVRELQNRRVVLAVGGFALQALAPDKGNEITKWRGSPILVEVPECQLQ